MKKTQRNAGLVALLVGGTLLSACVGDVSDDNDAASDQQTSGARTLTFSTWQWSEPGYGPFWKAAVEEFETRQPDVTVEVKAIPGAQYWDQLAIEVAAGNAPDLIHTTSSEFYGLQATGNLAQLDAVETDPAVSDIPDTAFEPSRVDDHLYAYPVSGRTLELIYNKRLFQEAGLTEPPTSPEEFLEYARKLTKKNADGVVEQYGAVMPHLEGGDGSNSFETLLLLSLAYGDDLVTDDGALDLTNPAVVKGAELLRTLYDEKLIPVGSTFNDQVALMAQDKAAMMIDGIWNFASFEEANPDAIDDFASALVPWQPPVSTFGQHLLVVSENSQVQADAHAFLAMLAEPEWQKRYFEGGQIPANTAVITPDLYADRPYVDAFVKGLEHGHPIPPKGLEIHYKEIEQVLVKAVMGNVLQQRQPVEEALQEAQAELESLLS